MKEIKNKRINNLEFGISTYIWDLPEYPDYEICRWKPNPYYARENEFIDTGENYYKYPNDNECYIHKKCFKHPETRYTIASFHRWKNGNYEFKFLGERPLDLTSEELPDFWELIKYGFKVLNNREDEDKEF